MSKPFEIPLFPLQTVLFPGGPLPLRIFEPRYVDMISRCLKSGVGFGILLIKAGEESGPASMEQLGTVATIVDWDQLNDGTLGVVVIGGARFLLRSSRRLDDGLNVGIVDLLESEPVVSLPESFHDMTRLLEGVFEDLGPHYRHVTPDFGDAGWVGCRLAELLPIDLEHKQHCLELFDPLKRLEYLEPLLKSLGR
ncbi:MAG TPA: LON peptidase substrate-binding domain-containing protein [Gammaproteobacteria bacterium]|nr:LON peptidase substrate-binding domain-containing protein [Gammaproteobacteria bacterium]